MTNPDRIFNPNGRFVTQKGSPVDSNIRASERNLSEDQKQIIRLSIPQNQHILQLYPDITQDMNTQLKLYHLFIVYITYTDTDTDTSIASKLQEFLSSYTPPEQIN